MEEKRDNKATAREYARALGYNQQQIRCLIQLWTQEYEGSALEYSCGPDDAEFSQIMQFLIVPLQP